MTDRIAKDGYDRVEHDGVANAKNISIVKSTATIFAVVNTEAVAAGNTTVEQGTTPWLTEQRGNVTIDSGTISVDSNTAWSDPNTYIGLATIDIGSAPTLTVDGSGVTQPVSGTFWQATQPVSVVGNVTVDQVDTVVAVTDITNPISSEIDGTALGNNQVTVDSTVNGTTILAASAGRHGVDITNQGSVVAYIGTGNVSASNGFELGVGESIFLPTDAEVKGFTASSSTTIGYLSYA